jgi:hypothetical protein
MPPGKCDAGAISPPFSAQRKRIKKLEAGAKSLEDGHRILLILQDVGQPSLSRMLSFARCCLLNVSPAHKLPGCML